MLPKSLPKIAQGWALESLSVSAELNRHTSPMLPQEGKTVSSPCQAEALKRCLEENNGDHTRCRKELEAFSTSCGAASKSSAQSKR
jgi:hypothetical protein